MNQCYTDLNTDWEAPTLKSFWEKDEESPFTLKKINAEQICEAEGALGVTLPDTYKKSSF